MKRLFLLFIIGILAILDSVISLHSISRVRISRSDLRVSTSSTGNRMDPSGTNTVTVNTGSLKKGQEEPIDYSHVEGQRNPEEWQTSVAPRRDVVYARALEVQMDMIRQLGMKEVEIEDRFKLRFSNVKQARIANMQYEGSRFRKVRLTYFDAGPNVQVRVRNSSCSWCHFLSPSSSQPLTFSIFPPSAPPTTGVQCLVDAIF